MRPLNLFKFILSLFTMSSLLSCTLKDKISTLNPQAVVSTSSLSLKVQNSDSTNTSRVELEEGTLILATAILDKAKKKDIKLSVKITSSAGDARVLERFSSYSKTVTIPAGLTSGFISIQTIDDVSVQDGDEEFTLSIFPEDTDEFKNSSSFVTLVIKDNEDMPTVSFQSATQNKNEDDVSGLVNLELSQVSGQTVSVRVSAVDETAQAGTDYTYSSQVISFAPGEVSKPVSFNLTNRSGIQASRTFKFQLSDVNNGLITTNTTSINTNEHTVTIIDVDQAGLSISDVSVNEGSNAVFTVSLSAAYTSDVSVDYSVTALTAVAGTDYTAAIGSVTIPTGATTANITIATLTNADVCAANKTFKVVLANAVNASLGDSEGVGTILDITNPTVSLASSTSSVTEGSNTSLSVNLSAVCATRNVTVEYSTTAGTATATTDFTTATAATLTITAGDTSGVIAIPTANDTIDEVDETFTVTLSSPTNATLGATTTSTVTITDNDAAPSVTLAASSNTISESGTTVTLTATLSAVSAKSVSLPFTITGTATQISDYTISSSPLTIAAGATTATITVTMVEDTDLEGDETVIVTLDTPTNASLGATTAQTITITDNDLGTFSISGITGENESTDDANLSNGLNPKINWGLSSGATGYKVSIVSDDQATTVCAEQTLGNVSTYQYSSGDCTLTVGTYYRARVKSTLSSLEQTASNTNFRFYVNTSPSLASNGEGPWYVMAGSSITINVAGGSSPTIGVASDADGDAFEFTALGAGSLGTVTTGTSSFTFAATSGVTNHGRAGVTYTITDTRGGTRSGTIYIHVMQAHTWTGATSAAWNTASNWCGSIAAGNRACAGSGTAPGSASTTLNLYFDDTCASSFTCSPSTTSNISVQGVRIKSNGFTQSAGHTLTIGSNGWNQSGGTFTGGDTTITMNGAASLSGGIFNSTTGTFYLNSNFSETVESTYQHNNGTFYVHSPASAFRSLTFTNTQLHKMSHVGSGSSSGYSITGSVYVNDLLTVNGTDASNPLSRTGTGKVYAKGDVSFQGAGSSFAGSIVISGNTNQTLTGVSTARIGNIEIASTGGAVTLSGTLRLQGTFTYTSGSISYLGSTVVVESIGNSLAFNANGITLDTVTFMGKAASSFSTNLFGTLNVVGLLTFRTQAGGDYGILGGTGQINAKGNVTYSHGGFSNTALVKLNGNVDQILTSDASTRIGRIEIASTAGVVTLSGTLRFQNAFTYTSGNISYLGSTVVIEPTGNSVAFNANGISLDTVTFMGKYSSSYSTVLSGTLTVEGPLTFRTQAGSDVGALSGSGQIDAKGNVTYSLGGFDHTPYVRLVGSSDQTLTGDSVSKIGNVLIASTGGSVNLVGTLWLLKSFTYTSGNIIASGSTVVIDANTGIDTITANGVSLDDVKFVGRFNSSTVTLSGTLNVLGDLTLDSEGLTTDGRLLGTGVINLTGNLFIYNYGFTGGSTTINFVGATNSTITQSVNDRNLPGSRIINKDPGFKVSLATNVSFNSTGQDLTIQGGTLDLAGYTLTVNDNFTINAGAELLVNAGSYTPNTGVKFINNGTITP